MTSLEVSVVGDIDHSFQEALRISGIQYSRHIQLSEDIGAVALLMHVFSEGKGAAPWVSFAAVIVAWLNAKSRRQVTVTTKSGSVFSFTGMSAKEVEKLLVVADRIEVKQESSKKEA